MDLYVKYVVDRVVARPHVDVRVFVGPDADHLAMAGTLTFRVEEFVTFVREGDGTLTTQWVGLEDPK